MIRLQQRGESWQVDFKRGETRLRGSLGTRNHEAANILCRDLNVAFSVGKTSNLWPELKAKLPAETYKRFADHAGVKEQEKIHVPTWIELKDAFDAALKQRIAIGKLAESTRSRYQHTVSELDTFLAGKRITELPQIDNEVIEQFKTWRLERIKKRKESRGGSGLVLDVAILHRLFALKRKWVPENPVVFEGKPGANPIRGAVPFTGDDLAKLRKHAADDLLAFALLRWTALRGSDAVGLTWAEVNFETRKIKRITQKRKKLVSIPIASELLALLKMEHERRKPQPHHTVLLNPETGRSMTRPRLYHRLLSVGKRAGVANAHPHRFRDTWAVDYLLRGGSIYEAAQILGDTVDVVEKHYASFVGEMEERVRSRMEGPGGLEACVTSVSQQPERIQ